MFILLTGKPPYNGRDERIILDQVKNSPLQISSADWPNISVDAINLLQNLLIVDYKDRISAKHALEHRWIHTYRDGRECPNLSGTLDGLSAFTSSTKLKDAVHVYLATQAINHEETKVLKENFVQIDKNGDGKISKSELMDEYIKTMDEEEARKTVEKIMTEVDTDRSGDIDYTEFLAACMNYSNYNSKGTLEAAFKMFDKDGSGFITVDEIKAILGNGMILDQSIWTTIINEADQNGDGSIDLKEFITLMTKPG